MQLYPGSWWAASARNLLSFPALDADTEADVVVIGGGFTGLSTAHHALQLGLRCLVLEANQIGWGASGRNGGIVVPRYKFTFPELERKYGETAAIRMYHIAHEALDTLEGIVRHYALDCGFARDGHLTPIGSTNDIARFAADADWLAFRMGDKAVRLLDARDTASKCGTAFYQAAYHEPRGGVVHPLEYCSALASALHMHGVRIHCATPVHSWKIESDGIVLRTTTARIHTRQLVIATNAYSDLTSAGRLLKKRLVPVASAVISTEPLSSSLAASILPDGEAATDSKRLTNYYRVLRDGAFFFGGRGGASSRATQRIFDRLRRDMISIYPQLESVKILHQWFGLVAATLDTLPHIGSLDARIHYGMGYSGRGVALSALFGKYLARLTVGEKPRLGPMSDGPFGYIPFHSARVPAKQVAITWKRLVDLLKI